MGPLSHLHIFHHERDRKKEQMVPMSSIAVPTTKFLSGRCNCILNTGAGTGDLSLVLEILHVC